MCVCVCVCDEGVCVSCDQLVGRLGIHMNSIPSNLRGK